MKKYTAIIIAVLLLLSLCACKKPHKESVGAPAEEDGSIHSGISKEYETVYENGHIQLPGKFYSHITPKDKHIFLSSAYGSTISLISVTDMEYNHIYTIDIAHSSNMIKIAASNDTIYFHCPDQEDNISYFAAFDLETGKMLWEKKTAYKSEYSAMGASPKGMLVLAKETDGGFFGCQEDGPLYLIDREGNVSVATEYLKVIAEKAVGVPDLRYFSSCALGNGNCYMLFRIVDNEGMFTVISEYSSENVLLNTNKISDITYQPAEIRSFPIVENEFGFLFLGADCVWGFDKNLQSVFNIKGMFYLNQLPDGKIALFNTDGNYHNYLEIYSVEDQRWVGKYDLLSRNVSTAAKTNSGYEMLGDSKFRTYNNNMKLLSEESTNVDSAFIDLNYKMILVN